jgi:hypothetical protein
MTINRQLVGGHPAPVRDCRRIAVVAVDNAPTQDLLSALPTIGGGFAVATYAESELAVRLGYTLERLSGSIDRSFFSTWGEVKRRTRMASVDGCLRIGDGRGDPAFFGGLGRLFDVVGGDPLYEPVQLTRLREFEAAGVDVVELPRTAVVGRQFANLNLVQPVAISLSRLREAEAAGRLRVAWSSR